MGWDIFQLIFGSALLYIGAELLVRGASSLASRFGISQMVIGLTVVAFGTSAPELVVGIKTAIANEMDVLVGNVIGSNIMNVALIVGISALASPIVVKASTVRREMPIALAAVVLAWLMGLNGLISRLDAVVLLGCFCLFTFYCFRVSKKTPEVVAPVTVTGVASRLPVAILAVLGGLVGLGVGADQLVEGATDIALAVGISTRVIGLTIVAIGTSLPELATSLVAALRKHPDISIGNILGSNVFNALLVLGTASMIRPATFSYQFKWIDGPVMVLSSVVLVGMVITGRRVSRVEGTILLVGYGVYLTLILMYQPAGI